MREARCTVSVRRNLSLPPAVPHPALVSRRLAEKGCGVAVCGAARCSRPAVSRVVFVSRQVAPSPGGKVGPPVRKHSGSGTRCGPFPEPSQAADTEGSVAHGSELRLCRTCPAATLGHFLLSLCLSCLLCKTRIIILSTWKDETRRSLQSSSLDAWYPATVPQDALGWCVQCFPVSKWGN